MDRVVRLFDDAGEPVDKFSTKPADKGPKNYVARRRRRYRRKTQSPKTQDGVVWTFEDGAVFERQRPDTLRGGTSRGSDGAW
jgi:hypothetical protein